MSYNAAEEALTEFVQYQRLFTPSGMGLLLLKDMLPSIEDDRDGDTMYYYHVRQNYIQ